MNRYATMATVTCLLGVLLAAACTNDSMEDESSDFDRPAMLSNYAENLIMPGYTALKSEVAELDAAAEDFINSPTESSLTALRQQLKEARLAWQDVSMFQFGPAENATLRSSINTYPADSEGIEDNIASGDYTLGTIDNQAAAGFPALGYLLYGMADSDTEILQAYSEASDAEARRTYLGEVVSFVKGKVDQTHNEWDAGGENYLGTFLSDERSGTDVGSSLGMLINAMVQHYERFFRDGKIGIPAGVRSAGVPRPTATEAHYGGYSLELAIANMQAIQRLYKGEGPDGMDGLGLEENLVALDAGDLSNQINTEMDQGISALQNLEDPLSDQISTDNEPVLTTFEELQQVVTILKADMTSILGITITFQDNDGD